MAHSSEQHPSTDQDDVELEDTNRRLEAESIQHLGSGEPNEERPDQAATQVSDSAATRRDEDEPPAGVNG